VKKYLFLIIILTVLINISVVVADPEDSDYNCDTICRWVCSDVRGKYNGAGDTYYYKTYHRSYWPGWAIVKDWTFYGYDEWGFLVYAEGGRFTGSDVTQYSKTYYRHVTFAETISKRYPACHLLDWISARAFIGPPGIQ